MGIELDAYVTEDFQWFEFFTGLDEGDVPHPAILDNIRHLAWVLQQIRNKYGKAVKLISGYRPPDKNTEVGGVPNSIHQLGLACDFYVVDENIEDVWAWLRDRSNLPIDQAILKDTVIHMSTFRPNRAEFFSSR